MSYSISGANTQELIGVLSGGEKKIGENGGGKGLF
jgi:hypothetical protein